MPVETDADQLVRELNAHAGCHLSVVGVAAQGETGGAIYVRWPDGHKGVVRPSDVPMPELQRTAEVLAMTRSLGLPMPRYEVIVPLADRRLVVQERLPGAVRRLDVAKLEAMVESNERFAGILADRPDVPVPTTPTTFSSTTKARSPASSTGLVAPGAATVDSRW